MKRQYPSFKNLILFYSLNLLSQNVWAQNYNQQGYDPSFALQSFFGNSCPLTSGQETAEALAQNQELGNIIASIKSDPKCQGLRTAFLNLERLSAEMLVRPLAAEKRLDILRSEIFDLETAILEEQKRLQTVKTTDPLNLLPLDDSDSYLRTLMAILSSKRINMIENQRNSVYLNYENRLSTFGNLADYSKSLFLALENQEDCLTGGTSTIAQVASHLLSLSSTLMSGYSGAAMYAGGIVVDNFFRYLRKRDWATLEKEAYYDRMGIALPCAIESITRSYCESKNLSNLSLYFGSQVSKPKKNSDLLLNSIELLTEASNPYLRWITRLQAGSEPTSTPAANRKTSALQLRLNFDKFANSANGLLGEAISKTLSRPSSTAEIQRSNFNSLHDLIRGNMFGNDGTPGVFKDVFSQDYDCGPKFYLYTAYRGTPVKVCTSRIQGESCEQCLRRQVNDVDPDIIPNLDQQSASIAKLIAEAQTYLDLEISTSQENNPVYVIDLVDQKQNSFTSALDFIKSAVIILKQFTQSEPFISNNRALASLKMQLAIYQEALILLNKNVNFDNGLGTVLEGDTKNSALRELMGLQTEDDKEEAPADQQGSPQEPLPAPNSDPFKDAQLIVNALSNSLARGQDIFYTTKPLFYFVDQYLLHMVKAKKIPADVALTLRLNFQDRLAGFLPVFTNLETVKSQTQNAQKLFSDNLDILSKAFAVDFKTTLAREYFDEQENGRVDDRLALKCVLYLSLPESIVPSAWLNGYCKDRVYNSVYAQSGLFLDYNTWANKRKQKTATFCSNYDFLRKSNFFKMASFGVERDNTNLRFGVKRAALKGAVQAPNPRDASISQATRSKETRLRPSKLLPWNWKRQKSNE